MECGGTFMTEGLFFYFKISFHLDLELYLLDEFLNLSVVGIDGSYFLETFHCRKSLLKIDMIYGNKIQNLGAMRIFLEEYIGVLIGFFMETELVSEIREHIKCLGAIFIERKKSLVYLVGYLILSLDREGKTKFQIQFGIGIVHQDEILVYKFCFLVISFFFIQRSQQTVEVFVEFFNR